MFPPTGCLLEVPVSLSRVSIHQFGMVDFDQNKLFVGGISRETVEEVLRNHFGKYGDVVESVIARDRTTGGPRGFGFVSFSESSAVEKALQDSHVILERTVDVKKAIPRSEQKNQQQNNWSDRNNGSNSTSTDQFRTKKIFVGGLAPSLTEGEFKSYFGMFGRITDVVVMYDNVTSRPRGFGFITFDSEDAVEEVMKNNFHELTGKLVEVKRAVPKEGNNYANNGHNARMGSGRDTLNNNQLGNSPLHYQRCGVIPGFGTIPGYGGSAGYPYGVGFFGGGFHNVGFGGFGYGVTPLAPGGPWNNHAWPGIRASPFPYGNVAVAYPRYVNGGIGVMGVAANSYDGVAGTGGKGELRQHGSNDTQVAADLTPVQSNGGCGDDTDGKLRPSLVV